MSVRAGAIDLEGAHRALVEAMRRRGRVLVAFSGGVDSGLVARVAHDALGEGALAVVADAESVARWELEEALAEAGEIGISVRVVPVSELANPAYTANPTNRCYFCRQELGGVLRPLADALGYGTIADGVNVSDLGDDRPGIRAMDEAGFWHPLVDAGLGKAEVRALARALGLSFHDKPSNACLSSRIAHGDAITVERLRRVEAAEIGVRALGFRVVRVRSQGETARIEVLPEDVPRLTVPETWARAERAVRDAGYADVTVDRRGYRSRTESEMP